MVWGEEVPYPVRVGTGEHRNISDTALYMASTPGRMRKPRGPW